MEDMSEEEFLDIDKFVAQKSIVIPVITAQNLSSIYQCPDQQMYRARIQFLFTLDQYAFDEPTLDALIDLMHAAILFASDNDFSYPKAIVFLSIFVAIFQLASSDPYYLPNELYRRYERILLAHAIDRPPKSCQIFELSDIQIINEFFINTLFRHLKSIVNSYTQKILLLIGTQTPVQFPPCPIPPLARMTRVGGAPEPDGDDRVSVVELRERVARIHRAFVSSFETKEKQLLDRIEELERRVREKQGKSVH